MVTQRKYSALRGLAGKRAVRNMTGSLRRRWYQGSQESKVAAETEICVNTMPSG